jgi:hypothetical protein
MGLAAIQPLALELRHNDEALGRVFAGAVDVDLEVCNGEARFWAGLRAVRSRVALPRQLLPRPGTHLVTLVVR